MSEKDLIARRRMAADVAWPTARDLFQVGNRVRLVPGAPRIGPATTGRVVGFGREPQFVRVVRDGATTPERWHVDFWVHDTTRPDPPVAAPPPQEEPCKPK